jgi:hypothetical protein
MCLKDKALFFLLLSQISYFKLYLIISRDTHYYYYDSLCQEEGKRVLIGASHLEQGIQTARKPEGDTSFVADGRMP